MTKQKPIEIGIKITIFLKKYYGLVRLQKLNKRNG